MATKGAIQYEKFKAGKWLTRKEALLAQCYECNGFEAEDCQGDSCPLYGWSPYRKRSLLSPLGHGKPLSKRQGIDPFVGKRGRNEKRTL